MSIDTNKHIYEGWTVQNFIDELEPQLFTTQNGRSWKSPIKTRQELKEWCMSNQPYYKKYIKEVVDYFANKFEIK